MTRFRLPAAVALAAAASMAGAQAYPSKPVRVVSTFSAGSTAEGLMRLFAQKMSESIGQPVVVEAQAGAGGVIGAQAVARAAPDGHTLLYTLAATMVTAPHLLKSRAYELKDFTPIIVLSRAATCLLVSVSIAPGSVRELIDHARKNPGKLAYGSNGVGGNYHLEMETLKQQFGLDITHVPYKGGTDALLAAVAGTVPVAFAPCSAAITQARAGKVRVLALLDLKRSPDFPDLPAMAEQVPDYQKLAAAVDLYGPAGIPPATLRRVHADLERAAANADVRVRMKEISFPYDGMALEEMAAQRRKDFDFTGRALKAAGLHAQ
jgi:tripartite-type tricarboxylate transporter receptor subunit TctC